LNASGKVEQSKSEHAVGGRSLALVLNWFSEDAAENLDRRTKPDGVRIRIEQFFLRAERFVYQPKKLPFSFLARALAARA
jgi:hypothetical protein